MVKYETLRLRLTEQAKAAIIKDLEITLHDCEYDPVKDENNERVFYFLSSRVNGQTTANGEPLYQLAAYRKDMYKVELPTGQNS